MSEPLPNMLGLDAGSIVYLYIIDFNPVGQNVKLYFTPSDSAGGNIVFGGQTYLALPIEMGGFEKSSEAGPPEPTLTIANVNKGGNSLLTTYNDLLGAKITRILTFTNFLDFLADGVTVNPTADATAMIMPEIWFIEQKVTNTPIIISWRLKSVLDLNGKMIPARLILKSVCSRIYRVWDSVNSVFSYSLNNACPYSGAAKFTRQGVTTTDPTLDFCSKDVPGCAARFGSATLPGWFFPGVTRLPK
jgi:lambda family phage minor tail protein L